MRAHSSNSRGRNRRHGRLRVGSAIALAVAAVSSTLSGTASGASQQAASSATPDARIINPVPGSVVTGPEVEVLGDLTGSGADGSVAVVYVVDVSGSTLSFAGDCNADGVIDVLDDPNFDGQRGTILDCEILGVTALNAALGPRGDVEVGLVAFGSSAASADVLSNDDNDDSTDEPGEIFDYFVAPLVDGADANRVADVLDVSVSLTSGRLGAFQVRNVGTGTSFNAAVNEALGLLSRSSADRKFVFMLSDGQSSLSTSVLSSAASSDVRFNTFAVGTGTGSSPCGSSPLGRLATGTGGVCSLVTDPTALASEISTGLEGLTVEVQARAGQLSIDPVEAQIDPLGRWKATLNLTPADWTVAAIVRDEAGAFVSISIVDFTVTGPGFQYTALGDSFSAGEGIDPWRDDDGDWDGATDPPFDTACHRSGRAYPMLIEEPGLDVPLALADETRDLTRFAACSGGVLADVFERQQAGRNNVAVPVQFDAVNSSTDLVTITIGGNDAQFSDIVTHCATNFDCQDDNFVRVGGVELTLREYVNVRLALLASQLRQAYEAIALRAPQAEVIVAGYPHLFGTEGSCAENVVWPRGEREFLLESVDRYDALMARAAELAGVRFVSVVDAFAPGIPCSNNPGGTRYLNGADVAWNGFRLKFWESVKADDQSFHPTSDGQAVYAELIQAELDRSVVSPNGFAGPVARLRQAAPPSTLIPDWVKEIMVDLPDLSDAELEAVLATQVDGLDISSIRSSVGADDPCGLFAVRGQRLEWSGEGFAPDSSVTVTVGAAGPSQQQFTAVADAQGIVSGIAVVPGDAELVSAIAVEGVDPNGVMRLLNGRFYIAESDTPCLGLAAEAGELDLGAALYRARSDDSIPNGQGSTALLERNVDAAALLLGFDDSRYDSDGDGWVAIGKYTRAQSEFVRYFVADEVPYVAVQSDVFGCVTLTARSLNEPARNQPRPLVEVGRGTADCPALAAPLD
jgi:lysophospholipase L1-like esterase